jgi:hypothetical protein
MLGGFLRQMNETIKYNRELLKNNRHKPFEKKSRKTITVSPTQDPVEVNGDDLKNIRKMKIRERIREDGLTVILLTGVALITWLLMSIPW